MQYVVMLQPSCTQFSLQEDELLLSGAHNQNIILEHSCGTGQCGACKAKVISGTVDFEDKFAVLGAEQKEAGVILTCTSKAKSDLILEADYYPELSSITKKTVPCKVASIDFPAEDVAIIRLRLPPTSNFIYLPGQYIDVSCGGVTRSYSIASAGVDKHHIELHVRKVAGGQFSEMVFNQLKIDQLLRLHGPLGSFFVRESNRPLIFIAGGTGFAPVKAMVESLLAKGDQREIHIYWGQRIAQGIYTNLTSEWAAANANIHSSIIISDDDGWPGRRGLVHQAVMDDFPDLSAFTVYACGSTAMISAARQAFLKKGLGEKDFISDAFLPALAP